MSGNSEVTSWEAVKRGLSLRCPACGEGRLFRAYLKVADECPACGEHFHHHRADDFPAYIVIVIVGHVVVPLMLALETAYAPEYWVHLAIWPAMIIALSLALLPLVKGGIVALQWALGMHGFEEAKKHRDIATATARFSGSGT
jgi:uncharacterized protein (DUF983 family)